MGSQHLHPGPVGGRPGAIPTATPQHLVPAPSGPCRQLVREATLPDAGLPTEQDDPTSSGSGRIERFEHLRELAVATDEQGPFCILLPIHGAACGIEA